MVPKNPHKKCIEISYFRFYFTYREFRDRGAIIFSNKSNIFITRRLEFGVGIGGETVYQFWIRQYCEMSAFWFKMLPQVIHNRSY